MDKWLIKNPKQNFEREDSIDDDNSSSSSSSKDISNVVEVQVKAQVKVVIFLYT